MLLQRHNLRVCRKKHKSHVKTDDSITKYAHNSQAQRVFKTAPLYAVTNPEEAAPQDIWTTFTTFFESLWSPSTNPDGSTVQKAGMSYVYDEDGTLIAQTLTGGAQSSWGQSARYIYLPTASGPMPVAAIYGTKHYAVQSDHLNTPRRLIQSDGQVAWQWAYSAFGDEKPTIAKTRFANAELNQSFGTTSVPAVTFNLRYPGQYFDQESGLHYNYHRSYSATVGRYTQADPIGLDGGWNRFGYVGGNPLLLTDPKGLAGCYYSVTTGTFACGSNSGRRPPIVIPPGSTHSGRNSCKNNPECFDESNDGPIPPGCYIPEPHDSKPGFWRLIPVGGQSKSDSALCRLGLKRCGFQLHPGTVSLGCITVSTSALQIYTKISDLLSKEYPNNLICVGVD